MPRTIPVQGQWAASVLAATVLWSAAPAAAQQSPAAQRGLTFARVHCAQCHLTGTVSESTLKIAPPFRDLHLTTSLCCVVLAKSPKVRGPIQMDFVPDGFRSSCRSGPI
jgi:hypothetical protein